MSSATPVRVAVSDFDGTQLRFGQERFRILPSPRRAALRRMHDAGWKIVILTGGEMSRTLLGVGAVDPAKLRGIDRKAEGWHERVIDPSRNWMHLFASGGREELAPGETTPTLSPLISENADVLARFSAGFDERLKQLGAEVTRKAGIYEVDWSWLNRSAQEAVVDVVDEMRAAAMEHHDSQVREYWPSTDSTDIEFHAVPMLNGVEVPMDKGVVVDSIQRETGAREMIFFGDDVSDIPAAEAIATMREDGRLDMGRIFAVDTEEPQSCIPVRAEHKLPPRLRAQADVVISQERRDDFLRYLAIGEMPSQQGGVSV